MSGNVPDDREEVEDHPEDPRPAIVDSQGTSDVRLDEALERVLDDRRDLVLGRELALERDVAEATDDESPVLGLVPVVEAVAPVVRDLEELLLDRLGRDHLAAGGNDESLDVAEKPARVAVGGDDDGLRASLLDRIDPRVLVDLDACLRGTPREPPDEPCGLQDAVRRMEERCRVAAVERWRELLSPFDAEPCIPERLVLLAELVPLLLVRGEAQASGRSEGIARERGERFDLCLGPAPDRLLSSPPLSPVGARGREPTLRGVRSRRSGRSRRRRSRAPRRGAP